MGVPKFFRYISERYPCLSEVVREHQIPEFDNLYLDMNGIIHVCSHPNDNDPHFRISEESIFSDIFHYIETLFRLIQPQRLFFMAVDGVAPRAKMNQQRGRRFRTAKDMSIQEAKARANNEVLPDAERFDSNCITPGTVFMSRLHAQLRYFVSYKISTDKLWQKPTIILSGHETPGEGEHKIMDYIRYMKSQPDYDPNTRHCLYGLDADLIMLGLCTHEPHFSLLREEVKFGRSAKNKVRASVPEEIRFYLLHLSLMREYLDLEFQELKSTLPFPYNLENVIDDWVMMGFLVGNDFIPHLPNLHIANGALPILYKAYKDILPTVGGYINEGGTLNLPRFQKYMEKLAGFDLSQFKDTYADLKYFQMKTGRRPNENERTSYKNGGNEGNGKSDVKDPGLAALIQSTDNMLLDDAREREREGGNDIFYSSDDDYEDDDDDAMMFAEFYQHKNDYYINKLEYTKVTDEVLRSQAEGYVRAIQWNLNYYYNGCCSWSWFYPHHYAPFISDIKNFENLKLEFHVGEPFLPFQQLLAVLPSGSKKLLPEPFQELMVNEDSPIIDFYPSDFKTDMNGKKQEWEAVVLIPFINQDALLKAMATKYDRLTDEEKRRNSHGPMLIYNYTPENQGMYEAPEYYPALNRCYAKEVPMSRESIFVEQSKLVKGLCPGVRLDVYFPGFPTLNHLLFTAELKKAKVKVFNQPSSGDNMILTLKENPDFSGPLLNVAMNIIDKTVFVNWPHLTEAKVIAVADQKKRIVMKHGADGSSTLVAEDLSEDFAQRWLLSKKGIEEAYFSKMGVNCKNTVILVYACNLEGRKYVFTNNGRVSHEKKWTKIPSTYAAQTLVRDIAVNEPEFIDHLTLDDLFKPSSICFTLGTPHYGAMGTVCEGGKNGRIKLSVCITLEPDLEPAIRTAHQCRSSYMPGHVMSQRLGISSHLLSRLTGSIFIVDGERGGGSGGGAEHPQKTNIGLNLKFTKRNEEVCGYTRKENGMWLYSTKAEQLINDYMKSAPDVISYIATNVGDDIYYVTDIFPQNSAEEMKKLTSWLSQQDFMKAERIPCGSEILQEEVVSVIEKIIDFTKNKTAKTVVMQIKPHLLLIPKPNVTGLCPDANAVHKVFDRIVCVRESFTVPLGMKGTIIGIQSAENEDEVIYDVVFDKEFPGGIKIRCSSNRGYRMTRKGFLNLSHGVRLENNKVKDNSGGSAVHQSENERFDSTVSWKNNQRSSAFASCNIKGDQTDRQQDRSVQPFHKQKTQIADSFMPKFASNSEREGKVEGGGRLDSNKPSSEFQAMWNELKKAGTKPLSQGGQPAPPSGDASDVLKKMLKIADTSPKRKPNNSNSNSLPSSREVHKDGDKGIQGNIHDESSSVQLESFVNQRDGGKPVYTYEPSDCNGKTYTVAKVYIDIPPDIEKSFTGRPSVDAKSAMESAAVAALHSLRLDDESGVKSLSKPPVSTVSIGYVNNSSMKRPTYPANSYGSTLPQPPPLLGYNSGIHQQGNHFQHHPQYRNNSGNSGHKMNNSFNSWFNTDLPTPPQQWYQNSRPPHQNNDGRHLDWKQRQDSQVGNSGAGGKQHYQPQQYYSPSQHQHLPPQSYQNFSYQRSNTNMVNQNAPNWRQIRPIPPLVGPTPFVPLQAITQCRTRPSSCSNFISTGTNSCSSMQRSGQSVVDASVANNVPSGSNQSRPSTVMSQPRRSRIAANFNVKLDS